jgi:hypothetical protein
MAAIAIFFVFWRMQKSRHIPGRYSVTHSAVATKQTIVDIYMTLRAIELTAEQSVVCRGYISPYTPVLHVAFQAVFLGLMKADLRSQQRGIREFVALQAHPPRDTAPGHVT